MEQQRRKTGLKIVAKMSKDEDKHWDFLDETQALTWVDLTQECRSSYQDNLARVAQTWTYVDRNNFLLSFHVQYQDQEAKIIEAGSEWGHKNCIATFDLQQSV